MVTTLPVLAVLLAISASIGHANEIYVQPEQIHLSLGTDPSQMIVTWLTVDKPDTVATAKVAEFDDFNHLPNFNMVFTGTTTKFQDGGAEQRVMYIHRVIMKTLIPGKRYWYHVGTEQGWSAMYWFQAQRNDSNFSPRFAVYGDMGNVNGKSIPFLQDEVQAGTLDAVLHVGDFAYNMDTDNARVGDEFMRQIEPIAAYIPYMTCPGNHEAAYNFSNYANRFTMLQSNGVMNNHYYSFNYGPAHIIGYSGEFYFFVWYGWEQIRYQYEWLERDLQEANKPENRAKHPWIIVMGHRPFYCSNNDDDDCRQNESIVRTGLPLSHEYGLEDLFYKYGVDLEFTAHEHSYERLWPIYNFTVYNGSLAEPYTNPGAPVHIITGSAGCIENLDPFVPDPQPWSAVRYSDYGYTRMIVHNATHLSLEQMSADKEGEILDAITIIKDKHGPYTP